jgi:hypothetical protein
VDWSHLAQDREYPRQRGRGSRVRVPLEAWIGPCLSVLLCAQCRGVALDRETLGILIPLCPSTTLSLQLFTTHLSVPPDVQGPLLALQLSVLDGKNRIIALPAGNRTMNVQVLIIPPIIAVMRQEHSHFPTVFRCLCECNVCCVHFPSTSCPSAGHKITHKTSARELKGNKCVSGKDAATFSNSGEY